MFMIETVPTFAYYDAAFSKIYYISSAIVLVRQEIDTSDHLVSTEKQRHCFVLALSKN